VTGHSVVFSVVVNVYDDAWIFGILMVKAMAAIGEFDKISDFHFSLLFYMYIIAEILNCSRKK
jgi:hypothetical protein